MDIGGYVKAHPVQVGAVVVIGGIVFLALTGVVGGGSSSAAASDNGPSAAELAAQSQLQLAQIQAGAQNNALNEQLQEATLNYQYQMASLAAQSDLGLKQIQSNEVLETNQTAAELEALKAQLSSSDSQAKINADLQLGIISTVTNAQTATQQIAANAQIAQAQAAASASNKKSRNSLLGGIASGIFGLFSDRNLKRDIEQIGTLESGIGLYSYRYEWSDDYHIGVMAQELASVNPGAVFDRNGHLMINSQAPIR
jgi:hypothetical protein